MWPTLSCPGGGLPALRGNPGPVPARLPALVALEEFRGRLHKCLTARADALFDLADAVLCSDHAVRSLVQLSLEPEFRRGHGALDDALAAGRVDDERLFCLLTEALPPLVDGDEAARGSRITTPSTTGCWAARWPGWQRARPRRSGTPAPAGPGCGSRSTRPPIPGRTRGAPRAGSTSTMAPATAGAPARPPRAGSTSSPP